MRWLSRSRVANASRKFALLSPWSRGQVTLLNTEFDESLQYTRYHEKMIDDPRALTVSSAGKFRMYNLGRETFILPGLEVQLFTILV